MTRLRQFMISLVAALLLAASGATAGSSVAYSSERITARLITAENGVGPEASAISAALEITLAEGWKTYWRAPGAVGYPAELDWSGSSNLAGTEFQWPAPTRFEAFDIENYGYETAVTFPIRALLEEPGKSVILQADVNLLVCADLCVPELFTLSLVLPPGTGIDRDAGAKIAAAVQALPVQDAGFTVTAAALDRDAARLEIALQSDAPMTALSVIPDLGLDAAFGPPEIALGTGATSARVGFDVLSLPETLPPFAVIARDGPRAAELTPALGTALPTASAPSGLAWFFLLAFIGGIILNVMPCVLPVLTIKFASVVKAYDQTAVRTRAGFLATALGVLAFMWALALALIAIRAGGGAVGWGIQFQSPVFLAVMAGIVTLFAANLFGLFEITLPQSWNTRMAGAGGSGLGGDFATGALAAVLATPCSAPFLGTAVTFALAGSAGQTLAIFTALGLGLALPYLAVAVWPRLVRGLPKPGAWMDWVKRVMGVLLLATAAWLIWVLSGVAGRNVALMSLALFVAAILVVALMRAGTLRWGMVVACLAAGIALPTLLAAPDTRPAAPRADGPVAWTAFAPQEIAGRVSAGEVVFVDVTADWCLSCKANKALVLDRMPVVDALASDGVTAMMGDWTRPDDTILGYLKMNGRAGIPFNIVYGPGAPDGIALPELLTPGLVMDALAQARG